jgi:hypothetical protein
MGSEVQFAFASRLDIELDRLNLVSAKIQDQVVDTVCSNLPNAFWHRKKYIVALPYVKDFSERKIPTKARPIQMNAETLDFCQKEIADLLVKNIIRKSKSPWSCAAFYAMKNAELKKGPPRFVIN